MLQDAERPGRHSHAERGNEKIQLFRELRYADFPKPLSDVSGTPLRGFPETHLKVSGNPRSGVPETTDKGVLVLTYPC
jgi:hypothetical protein